MAMDVQTFSSNFFPVTRRSSEVQLGAFFSADLNLQTLEGDRVQIAFDAGESLTQSRSETQVGDRVSSQEFSSVAVAASRYSIVVEGDLNEDELNAIQQLVDAITPIARDFFSDGAIDIEDAALVLGENLGEIQSLQLGLERTVFAAITSFGQVRNVADSSPGNLISRLDSVRGVEDSSSGTSELGRVRFPNLDNIRDLPELINAVVETVLSAQTKAVFDNDEILNTLHDLMSFLRERFSIFGHPGLQPFETPGPSHSRTSSGFSLEH